MKKKIVEETVVKKEVVVEVLCDSCKQDIKKLNNEYYYSVHTYHHRWGNDSSESSEFYEFCTSKCLLKNLEEYIKEPAESDSYDIELERTKFIGK